MVNVVSAASIVVPDRVTLGAVAYRPPVVVSGATRRETRHAGRLVRRAATLLLLEKKRCKMNRETYWLVASTVLSHVAATWSIGRRSSTSGSTGFCWLQAKLAGGSSRLTSSAQTTQRTITGPFSLLLCCETATRWSRQN